VRRSGKYFSKTTCILTIKSTKDRTVDYVFLDRFIGGRVGGELSEPLFRGVGSKGNLFCGGDVGNKVSKDKIR